MGMERGERMRGTATGDPGHLAFSCQLGPVPRFGDGNTAVDVCVMLKTTILKDLLFSFYHFFWN